MNSLLFDFFKTFLTIQTKPNLNKVWSFKLCFKILEDLKIPNSQSENLFKNYLKILGFTLFAFSHTRENVIEPLNILLAAFPCHVLEYKPMTKVMTCLFLMVMYTSWRRINASPSLGQWGKCVPKHVCQSLCFIWH